MGTYFNGHSHTMYSNLRLLDCIIRPKDLIKTALELGLSGVAITDHEALCAHMEVNKIAKEMQETNPDFTIALGNEIYLTETRTPKQKYYHFILIAKDRIGYEALCKLSSIAWYNMYKTGKMERVPTLKTELKYIMKNYKGHVIATTACIGGELSVLGLAMEQAIEEGNHEEAVYYNNKILDFLSFCIDVFGKEDFYIEVAPSTRADQLKANYKLYRIAKAMGIKMTVGTDAHYLKKEDRTIHKAYLTSKEGEREVDEFYEFSRLMDYDECYGLLKNGYMKYVDEDLADSIVSTIMTNTIEIKDKITFYSLEKHQSVPEVRVKDYPKSTWWGNNNSDADEMDNYPNLERLFVSDNIQERYWVNECWDALNKKIGMWYDHLDYVARLDEEARVKTVIGEKLQTCMFAYPNTLKHYIDLFWECGSTVGAGRGSACAALNHYLLGITQLDPMEWDLPFWRYLNDERVELGDVDIDLAPSKIQTIFKAIREERGELGLVQVCTFGTEATKSTVKTACRGYRSKDYPEGIDVDEAAYMSGLIPVERGIQWSLKEVVYGNPDKDRKPQTQFINAVNQYPGLLDIMFGIENLVCRRGSHASGVLLMDPDWWSNAAIMRTPSGALVTQWDLHDSESGGAVKYDFLLTSVQDIIIKTIELLQKNGIIEQGKLRDIYDKYLHPAVIPQDDAAMWNALANNEVLACFQFDSAVGSQAAKKIKPRSPVEMSDANGLMRLMTAGKGAEQPLDKYVRFKSNIKLWYKEMDDFGLTKQEEKYLEPYFLSSYGVPPSQEQMMKILMDENICHFTLAEANAARKVVGKKQLDKIPALKEKVLAQASSEKLGQYVWEHGLGPQMGYSFSVVRMALTHLTCLSQGSFIKNIFVW